MTKERVEAFKKNLKKLNPEGKLKTMKRDLAENDNAENFGIIDFILITD